MARLRLFANLRELAGTPQAEIEGSTVAEVLTTATEQFGSDFGRALESSQVWVNGDQANADTPVPADAEVALIPPVSGGALSMRPSIFLEFGFAALLIVVLFAANALSLQWLAVAAVLVGAMWVFDVVAAGEMRGMLIGTTPGLLAVLGSVLATYRFGAPGMAAAVAGTVMLVLLWAIANQYLRSIESLSGAIAVAPVAAFGSGSLVLLRLFAEEAAFAFLFSVGIAILVSWLSDRSDMPVLDPLVAMIVAAITAGAVAGAVWTPDLLSTVAASVAGALALVAGRNLGTLLRAGGFFVSGPIPGSLHYLDGLMMASGPFWVFLTILS
jgi:molybdopterin converting factor small subunit